MDRRTSHRGLVGLLLFLGLLLALAAAGDRWLAHTTLDTPTWTATSSRLIDSPAVRDAIADYTVRQALGRAGPVADVPGLATAARSTTREFLASDPGKAAWRAANRTTQIDLLRALDRTGGPGSRSDTVRLDLSPVVSATLSRLTRLPGGAGLHVQLPSAGVGLTVLHGARVRQLRRAVGVVRLLRWVLPLAALAAFLLALALSGRGWARTLTRIAVVLAIAGVLALIARPLLRAPLAGALVSGSADRAAVRAAWMIATADLRTEGVELIIAAVVVGVVSFAARLVTRR